MFLSFVLLVILTPQIWNHHLTQNTYIPYIHVAVQIQRRKQIITIYNSYVYFNSFAKQQYTLTYSSKS